MQMHLPLRTFGLNIREQRKASGLKRVRVRGENNL